MNTVKVALAAAVLIAPIATFSLPALAASAHNIQTGADTSNAADTAATAYMKQVQANHAPYYTQAPRPDADSDAQR